MTQIVPPRSEVPVEFKWDAYSVYPNDAAWEAEFKRVDGALVDVAKLAGTLSDSAVSLIHWFGTQERLVNDVYKLYIYASMFHEVDTADQTAAARNSQVMGLYARMLGAIAFAEPEILKIGFGTLRRWMQDDEELARYEHYFDQLERRQAHVRSGEVEELLGSVQDAFGSAKQIHSVLSDADTKFAPSISSTGEQIEITQGTIDALKSSPDRETRRTAFENYADAYLANKNSIATCLEAGIKQDVFVARARRYNSSLEASLSPNHIPTDVFHSLISTFKKNLPTWHRYWEIRRKALKLDSLHVYDIKAPLSEKPPVVPYAQAIEWICEGMAPLGEEYVATMRKGLLEQRWVDVYPNKGKRMGAFSSGAQGTHPFILMSYNDDLYSLSTLAHELGHSMHSYLTWKHQPAAYADYSLFVAEVASNFNQALVRDYLFKQNTDRDFQIGLIEEAMSNFHRYFFIMPTLARFELEIHERIERGEALTSESLMTLMTALFSEGYADKVVIDADRIGITWAQFPTHLYSNFYVYQYATGIAGAHALADRVLHEGPDAAERYLGFLKAGSSHYPLDVMKMAGVDLTSPEPVEKAFGTLAAMVDRLESLVG